MSDDRDKMLAEIEAGTRMANFTVEATKAVVDAYTEGVKSFPGPVGHLIGAAAARATLILESQKTCPHPLTVPAHLDKKGEVVAGGLTCMLCMKEFTAEEIEDRKKNARPLEPGERVIEPRNFDDILTNRRSP